MPELDAVDRALINEIGDSLPEHRWKVVENNGDHIVSEATIEVKGRNVTIQRRQFVGEKELLDVNKHLYDTSGRFSQREVGALGTQVANIPLSMLYNPKTDIMRRLQQGDKDHLKWWLNKEENQPFRTHKGKL